MSHLVGQNRWNDANIIVALRATTTEFEVNILDSGYGDDSPLLIYYITSFSLVEGMWLSTHVVQIFMVSTWCIATNSSEANMRLPFVGFECNVSTTIGWLVMKCGADIHEALMINFIGFDDPLTLHLVPPSGQNLSNNNIPTSLRRSSLC